MSEQPSAILLIPPFSKQSVSLALVTDTSVCSICVTYVTLCHAIPHQVLPTQTKEAEYLPTVNNHFKHVPLLTYLIWFSPKRY